MSTLIEETRAAAQGRWRDILNQVGIDDAYLKNLHGPCPICRDGKDRTLSIFAGWRREHTHRLAR